jgi:hypothetical protein
MRISSFQWGRGEEMFWEENSTLSLLLLFIMALINRMYCRNREKIKHCVYIPYIGFESVKFGIAVYELTWSRA